MWPKRRATAARISLSLQQYSRDRRALPGIATDEARETLAWQIVASLRRIEFTQIMRDRPIHPDRADPDSDMFDPERAALLHAQAGRLDEAVWLTFLAIHFGKHPVHGWRRLRDVYSGLGTGHWTWERVSRDPNAFRDWLRQNRDRIGGAFGNHRKYETLDPDSALGTADVFESYVNWIGPSRSHRQRFGELIRTGGNDPHGIFDAFYSDMQVARFGRLGKFDFLALLGRLDLAPIRPGSTYLDGATGPLRGARLLFGGNPKAKIKKRELEAGISELDTVLNVGMQVLEDSLCNWQKSPTRFIHFRG